MRKTLVYAQWIDNLRDLRGRARILARVERLAAGNAGDVKHLGGEYQRCVSTLALGIVFISPNKGKIS